MHYRIKLEREDDGSHIVTFPDFEFGVTQGEDEEEARVRAVDALETIIQAMMDDREAIPAPRKKGRNTVALSSQAAIKIGLYRLMGERGITKTELARRIGRHRQEIDRLLDLRRATHLDTMDAAFAALGARLEVEIEEAA